MLKAAALLV